MPFGSAPKEQLLLFFCSYLVIFSLILTFLISAMNANFTLSSLNLPVPQNFSVGSIGDLLGLFSELLLWVVPENLIPIYVQLPFVVFPKFGIGVIILSYVKDML